MAHRRVTVEPSIENLVTEIVHGGTGTTVALLTYTALLELRRLLANHGLIEHQFATSRNLP